MNTVHLAVRNLLRNRRRSVATLAAMVTGVCATLLFGGYAANVVLALQTGYVQLHGHLQIQRQGYQDFGSANPDAYSIRNYEHLAQVLRDDPELAPLLTVVTPKLVLGGIAGQFAAGLSTQVVAVAVVPEDQARLRAWDDYGGLNYAEPVPLLNTPHDALVLGTGVARKLQLCAALGVRHCPQDSAATAPQGLATPADLASLADLAPAPGPATSTRSARVELLVASARGAPNVGALNAVAAQNWGLKEIDDSYVLMHLAQAQRLVFGSGPPQVSALQLQLHHTADVAQATRRIRVLLAQHDAGQALEVVDYETLAPIYRQTIEFFDSVFGFIATLIAVIVLFTVGNTMGMAVVERTLEIGTLRAIGLRQRGIRQLFVWEGVLLGVAGAVLGTAVAMALAYGINHSGLRWAPPGYIAAYPVSVRVWGAWPMLAGCASALVLAAAFSAWWPARRAAATSVVEALRHA